MYETTGVWDYDFLGFLLRQTTGCFEYEGRDGMIWKRGVVGLHFSPTTVDSGIIPTTLGSFFLSMDATIPNIEFLLHRKAAYLAFIRSRMIVTT